MPSLEPAIHGLPRQTLLFDADDTLWENNVHFERAIAAFISFLDHAVHTPEQVREHLDRIERKTVAERGYGTESFRLSLVRCFEELSERIMNLHQHQQIMTFVDAVAQSEIELMPGVQSTLEILGTRHRLILVTKGNDLEQREKLRRSGLEASFEAVEVLLEKTAEAYRDLARRHGCEPGSTWMIGNSPPIGHQSGLGGWIERGLRSPSRNVGARARTHCGGTRRTTSAGPGSD